MTSGLSPEVLFDSGEPIINPRGRLLLPPKRKPKKSISRRGDQNNAAMVALCKLHGLPIPLTEQILIPGRKWRVDLYWPAWRLVVEIEGGIWVRGRHTRPTGFIRDIEKYNALTMQGYYLMRIIPDWIDNGKAMTLLIDWDERNR